MLWAAAEKSVFMTRVMSASQIACPVDERVVVACQMKRIIYCELMNDNLGRPYLDVKKLTGRVPTCGLKLRPGEADGDGSGELGDDGSIKNSLLLTKRHHQGCRFRQEEQ
jgi:hypothetical protein